MNRTTTRENAPFRWTCPYCERPVTISKEDLGEAETHYPIGEIVRLLRAIVVRCPNPDCEQITLEAALHASNTYGVRGKVLVEGRLAPDSKHKALPDYIPHPIRQDYYEACLISDLSPKASATLSRRCLQGMIRDFWGIKKGRLVQEIDALEEMIDPAVWQGIKAIKDLGNIGAHMEKDIDKILDVEPNEASLMIQLIETLLEDWYVRRHNRQENLDALIETAEGKKKRKKDSAEVPKRDEGDPSQAESAE